jgi:hypothetical protein
MGFTGNRAAVYVAGSAVAFTHEALVTTDQLMYTIGSGSTKTTWDSTTNMIVETSPDGSSWSAVTTGYAIDYLLAKVTFTTARAANTQVRISGSYLPASVIGDATSWDLTITHDLKKTTRFRSDWQTQVPLIKGGTAKFERWFIDDYFTHTVRDSLLLIVLYTTDTNGYKFFAYLSSDGVKSQVDDLLTEGVSLEIQGAISSF